MAGHDIGIDLGTTSIIIYVHRKGIVLEEPSVIAFNNKTNTVLAIGTEAYKMIGRTPGYITAEAPLKDGVISDHVMTGMMIKEFLNKASVNFMIRPRVAICVPSAITDIEKRSVVDVAMKAGARKVYLIDEPISAAIGIGIDISKSMGNMIVDIGGGTTDVAVISLNGVVVKTSAKVAGNAFERNIIKYLSQNKKFSIGEKMAEQIKFNLANVFNPSSDITMTVKGRDMVRGLPMSADINQIEIFDALFPSVMQIMITVRELLEKTPPELAADIHDNGIYLTGGGAMLKGLDEFLEYNLKVKVRLAEDPLHCVAIGTGRVFEHLDDMRDGFVKVTTYQH